MRVTLLWTEMRRAKKPLPRTPPRSGSISRSAVARGVVTVFVRAKMAQKPPAFSRALIPAISRGRWLGLDARKPAAPKITWAVRRTRCFSKSKRVLYERHFLRAEFCRRQFIEAPLGVFRVKYQKKLQMAPLIGPEIRLVCPFFPSKRQFGLFRFVGVTSVSRYGLVGFR